MPVPFEFMNHEKGFSIRQKKVEKMIQEKKKEEERALSFEYKAREIPAHVKKQKYLELMEMREKKRQDAKRLAMAKIKATENPFSFYERDAKHQQEKSEKAVLDKSVPEFPQFRASKVPWRVQVPLF